MADKIKMRNEWMNYEYIHGCERVNKPSTGK